MKLLITPINLVAREMGYRRLITYGLPSEGGGGSWSRDSRPRVDRHPLQEKIGWERTP